MLTSQVTAATSGKCGESLFPGKSMHTLTVLVASAANKGFEAETRTAAACAVARILDELPPIEVGKVSDKLIDDIANLLSDEVDAIKSYAATGLGSIGPKARRAIPALERALKLAQPATGSEIIGPSLGLDEAFRAAIARISTMR